MLFFFFNVRHTAKICSAVESGGGKVEVKFISSQLDDLKLLNFLPFSCRSYSIAAVVKETRGSSQGEQRHSEKA